MSLRPVIASLYQTLAAHDLTTRCKFQPTAVGRREGHLKKKCVLGVVNLLCQIPTHFPSPSWGGGVETNCRAQRSGARLSNRDVAPIARCSLGPANVKCMSRFWPRGSPCNFCTRDLHPLLDVSDTYKRSSEVFLARHPSLLTSKLDGDSKRTSS